MALVEAKELTKTYIAGDIPVEAIRGVSFSILPASFVSFIGSRTGRFKNGMKGWINS